jgi:hypothetical protein
MTLSIIRHQEIFPAYEHNDVPICIVGAGATGSRVFAALVELGLTNIRIYDFDVVEEHNLANQLFEKADVGTSKVRCCANWFKKKTGAARLPDEMHFINKAVPCAEFPLEGYVFLLTDTMKSRKEIFEKELKYNPKILQVFETRMASSYGNIYSFNPNITAEAKAWEASLISDDDAEVSACGSAISVGTTASIIANMAVWQFMLHLTDPAACDTVVNVFLKPLSVSTTKLVKAKAA